MFAAEWRTLCWVWSKLVWLTHYLCAETKLVGPVTPQLREIGAVTN